MNRRGVLQLPVYPPPAVRFPFAAGRRAFVPTDLSGLDIWLDAADSATLWQDSARTTPVTANSQTVAAWDTKGNGAAPRSATQTTASRCPTYQTGIQKGLPGIFFTTDDVLLFPSGPWFTGKRGTVFVVARVASSTNSQFIGSNNAGSPLWSFQFQTTPRFGWHDGVTNSLQFELFTPGDGASHLLSVNRDADTNVTFRRNRLTKATLTVANNQQNNAAGAIGGQTNQTAGFFAGHLHEVLYYDRSLSTAERDQVANYLWAKWFTPNGVIPDLGLIAWYKADGALWTDTARTTPVTADGQAVAAWDDASGNSHHLIQATAAAQPLYKTAVQNGRPVVRFDGTDDTLKKTFVANQPLSVFFVMKNAGPSGRWIWDGGTGTTGTACSLKWQTATQLQMHAGTPLLGPASTAVLSTWYVYAAIWDAPNTLAQLYLNGILAMQGNPGTNAMQGIALGATLAPSLWSAADIAEVVIYDRAMTTAERQQIEAYLNARWSIY